jgi:hypothetical protein
MALALTTAAPARDPYNPAPALPLCTPRPIALGAHAAGVANPLQSADGVVAHGPQFPPRSPSLSQISRPPSITKSTQDGNDLAWRPGPSPRIDPAQPVAHKGPSNSGT